MNNEEKIIALLEQVQGEMADMKAYMATKEDLTGLATKEDLQLVRGDIGNLYQNHEKHMAIISEGLGHLNERYAQLDSVEQTVDEHDHRIFALEQKVSNG